MIRILTASSDTFITDKIIRNSFRATDANVGHAGTLSLFKLYDESSLSGTVAPIELSRILLKFDYTPLLNLTSTILDLNSNNFKCYLSLKDVYGGHTTPTNFSLVVYPLSRSFDEGFGRDVRMFSDLDSANFVTASSRTGIVAWHMTGANAIGLLGSNDIDIIGSGILPGQGMQDFGVTQIFNSGEEDLFVDVTRIVSATIKNLIPDCGFRVSFSGSQETDTRTRFVKQFASRHATSVKKRPALIVKFDDSIRDHHSNFYFDVTGSLFLRNSHRGVNSNLLSGSELTQITGTNSLLLTLMSGSFTSSFTGSQHVVGTNFAAGIYSATFAIPSSNSLLKNEILNAGSATFTEVWSSLDRTVLFLSSTLVINQMKREAFNADIQHLNLNIYNIKPVFKRNEKYRFRLFAQDAGTTGDYKLKRTPIEIPSIIIDSCYYQIRDAHTDDIVVPFDAVNNSTRMSSDSSGMYFDIYFDIFSIGRAYKFDIMIIEQGVENIYIDVGGIFRVEE